MAVPRAVAQKPDADRITEEDKKVFKDFVGAAGKLLDVRNQKSRQLLAVNNLRQIGLALFEFETEYGSFPNAETAVAVKEATETKANFKEDTANDCFYQLIASGIAQSDRIFSLEIPAPGAHPDPKQPDHIEKCAFAYLSGMTAAGNPQRPLAVAPLLDGKWTFDPAVFGGRAVVLCVDNSVRSFPIEKDGRVLINGLDIFDPDQPFWAGKEPQVKWPVP